MCQDLILPKGSGSNPESEMSQKDSSLKGPTTMGSGTTITLSRHTSTDEGRREERKECLSRSLNWRTTNGYTGFK